ncbi:acyltransferase [Actinobacillus equuli subsp. haemolyticus]|uniref:acyltransferase n=1 Tax=Actinobacillus equuli TaxID=718 RepID=UPI0024467315|nr:acyltransferase [Actinobacillus equuli]WGE50680.1 acyltransferase [Actinobacillus equuli subsp. haemolyticus]
MSNKSINYQFKILIALAMVFVVAGHVGNPTFSFNGLFNYDYFHMPLFMFISGYFFNREITIKNEFIKQVKKLLLPLIGWNIVYGVLVTYLRNTEPFNFTMGSDLSFYSLFIRSFTMGDAFSLNVPSWFLFTLFLVKLVYILLRKIIMLVNCSENTVFLIFLLIGISGIYLGQSNQNFELKIQCSRVLYLSFWYAMGLYYKIFLEKYDVLSNKFYFSIILFLQFITLVSIKGSHATIVYAAKFNVSVFLTILLAFLGIAFWLRVSRILTPYLNNSKLVNYIADNTFDIMMHHALVLKLFIGLIFVLTSSLGIDFYQNFSLSLYKGGAWYSPLPWGKYFFYSYLSDFRFVYPLYICSVLETAKNEGYFIFK